jgi:hypothetical protein
MWHRFLLATAAPLSMLPLAHSVVPVHVGPAKLCHQIDEVMAAAANLTAIDAAIDRHPLGRDDCPQ